MAFGFGKLAVLESKLSIYEDLSKEMLDKLEKAVGTISENSNKIAVILERHENRLDESERSDQLILSMLQEIKDNQRKDIDIIHDRVSQLQKKVDMNAKFVIGAGAVLATIVAVLQVVPPVIKVLTPQANAGSMIEMPDPHALS
jgi:Mg2+ and Co2+ transporter CorA|tara:strand:+ start:571 stop:1002 length:432 start_codon:yes stop_codon:yes gene_type:complete